jgi:hypothetical protein
MTEDIFGELNRFRQYAGALQKMVARAQSMAPQSSEGADRSGAIRMVLGKNGLPESIKVTADWQSRLTAEVFSNAVTEAFQVAAGRRLEAWTKLLEDENWQGKIEGLQKNFENRSSPTPQAELPAAFKDNLSRITPRPTNEVVEDMIRAAEKADQDSHIPEAVKGAGSNANRKLFIVLSENGLETCRADVKWVAQQTAVGLSAALNDALASARLRLKQAAKSKPKSSVPDGLIYEAMSLFTDPRRLET